MKHAIGCGRGAASGPAAGLHNARRCTIVAAVAASHDEGAAEDMNATSTSLSYVFEGACHCGAIGFTLRTSQPPDRWQLRACQCRFCRSRGARTVSDPRGSLTFHVIGTSALRRYRFATRSADYLICGVCGVYIAAALSTSKGRFATVNVNAIRGLQELPRAIPVSYEGESKGQWESRREQRWTPVAGLLSEAGQ
jgi:hypothetical protein